MNERIKELMMQSGIVPIPNSTKPIFVQCPLSDIEKFAELVIRECASVVKKEMDYHANWCDDKILKHFGLLEEKVEKKVDKCMLCDCMYPCSDARSDKPWD